MDHNIPSHKTFQSLFISLQKNQNSGIGYEVLHNLDVLFLPQINYFCFTNTGAPNAIKVFQKIIHLLWLFNLSFPMPESYASPDICIIYSLAFFTSYLNAIFSVRFSMTIILKLEFHLALPIPLDPTSHISKESYIYNIKLVYWR